MGLLSFDLSVTGTYIVHLRFLVGKTEGAECTGCWTPLVNTCADETSLHKKISKKKSSLFRDGSMHECTG